MSWLTDPFAQTFTQRALVEVLVLALACGPLGVWILLYRQSYAAESISHGMLPGLVVAALAGAPLVLGAAGGGLLAAGVIAAPGGAGRPRGGDGLGGAGAGRARAGGRAGRPPPATPPPRGSA